VPARRYDPRVRTLAGLPPERIRLHLCWGSWHGPHAFDLELDKIVDLIESEFPDARLYVRSYDRGHTLELRAKGVEYELRETFESGLRFGRESEPGVAWFAGSLVGPGLFVLPLLFAIQVAQAAAEESFERCLLLVGAAEALREQVAAVLAPMGLHLAAAKTRTCHIDEGFDFLGFRIQRHPKRGTAKRYRYTYPSKKALVAVKAKVRALTRGTTNQTLAALCAQLNLVLRGWTTYFRHSVAKATFNYLCRYAWRRVICWLRHKHPRASWKQLRRRYLPDWWPTEGRVRLANPAEVPVTRYRYRGTQIPTPWTSTTGSTTPAA